jgi:hypothetical protein
MPRTKRKTCRANGRQCAPRPEVRPTESSTDPKPAEWSKRIDLKLHSVARWAARLHAHESAVLLCMIGLQPADGQPFAITHKQIAEAAGLHSSLSYAAVHSLRALGLVLVVEQGGARRANRYRVADPLPSAPPCLIAGTRVEGGAS